MKTFRSRPADVGHQRASDQARRFAAELRVARTVAGLTQSQLATRAGVSQQEVSRTERSDVGVSLKARCQMAAACGYEVALKLFPTATVSLRDSGQLSVATALVGFLHPLWQPRLEVPVAPGDLRAADMLLSHPDELVHIEIERGIVDFQAQLRASQLKREMFAARESRPVRLVLVVPDTHSMRVRLQALGPLLEHSLPLDSRRILGALRRGQPLGSDGLLVIRAQRLTRPAGTRATRAG
jgi:transcriptional regulator with XRE-family HTH domain